MPYPSYTVRVRSKQYGWITVTARHSIQSAEYAYSHWVQKQLLEDDIMSVSLRKLIGHQTWENIRDSDS